MHHAYLFEGGEKHLAIVRMWLDDHQLHDREEFVRTYGTCGIDDAHDITARASGRSNATYRVFVVCARVITTEAQNAFLKTLEEPGAQTVFVLIVPSRWSVLATIRSRVQYVALPTPEHPVSQEALTFLASSPVERIKSLERFTKKKSDESYDSGAIAEWVSELEHAIATIPDSTKKAACAKEFYHCTRYLNDRGALIKVLLEGLALTLPMIH